MRVKWLCAAFVSVLIMTTFGVTIPASAELHAVVEDSTTLVILDSDSTEVFRKEFRFAELILPKTARLCDSGTGIVSLMFRYVPKDTVMINPLPRATEQYGARKHLLVLDSDFKELLSADMRWRGLGCDRIAFPSSETLFILHADGGEVTRVDLNTKQSLTIPLSDWSHWVGADEEGPLGWMKAFPGNGVVITRSSYADDRSEVLLLSENGETIWHRSDRGVQRLWLLVDPANELVITERRYSNAGPIDQEHLPGVCYDLQAIAGSGEEAWVVSLGRRLLRRISLEDGKLIAMVRDIGTGQPGQKLPWRRLEIDPPTGVVEEQP